MGKRFDKKMLLLDEDDDYELINRFNEEQVIKYTKINPFPEIANNNIYTLQDIINDTKCPDIWTIPKGTPKEVINWIEKLFEYYDIIIRIVICNVVYESIEWKLLEWVEI